MRFDDRLLTVLNQPAEDRHDAAVRWRQLVDLVARAGSSSSSPLIVDALEAIRREAHRVEEPLRAAAARAIAALPLPLGLLEYFASDSLTVSAPVLAAATLDSQQWRALHVVADDETRRFIETLHPELGAGEAGEPEKPVQAAPVPEPAPSLASPSLHEVVERIERRRRLRSGEAPQSLGGSADATSSPALFRWECGPGGEIAWVEGAPRGPLIGRSIARPQESEGDRVDKEVVRAFAMRAPFRDAVLTLTSGGPVSGEWKISGVPAFEPADGRFAGYRGVALRETPAPATRPMDATADMLSDPDSLRELVHEIKTPLNAIIGFAEIIEGQYLGPADRGYRERAAEIVAQARLLLTAIDDLDFAAKIRSSSGASRERVDLVMLLDRAAGDLQDIGRRRGIQLDIVRPRIEVPAAVQPELADRLLFRLFDAVSDRSQSGERLQLAAEVAGDSARIAISRPAAMMGLKDSELFDVETGDRLRGAFSLRLVRGLARIAGGDLTTSRDSLALVFARA